MRVSRDAAAWHLKNQIQSARHQSRADRARRTFFFAGLASSLPLSAPRSTSSTLSSSLSLSLASALPDIACDGMALRAQSSPHLSARASGNMSARNVWVDMGAIFATIGATVASSYAFVTPVRAKAQTRTKRSASTAVGARWMCDARTNPSKAHAEWFILKYSACWIASVGVVIALSLYESFGKWGYLLYCGACAAPALAWPLMFPCAADRGRPLGERYIVKANLWIAVFGFIGNYWYTHYFYNVLKADYTFPAHRLNDVPISMYLMTHAYFMFYHVLSNAALRRIRTGFVDNRARFVFECVAIGAMSYTTAFMESLTICGFPYYDFENRHMAYTLGSAFYGIYFLVSFPMFLRVNETKPMPMSQVFWESMGSGMAVLCLLDFVRVYLRIPFVMRVR